MKFNSGEWALAWADTVPGHHGWGAGAGGLVREGVGGKFREAGAGRSRRMWVAGVVGYQYGRAGKQKFHHSSSPRQGFGSLQICTVCMEY